MPITPPNFGPRPKQIQKLKNDETVPVDGSLLGVNAAGKTDWLDVQIQDLVIPSTTGGRITNGTTVTPSDPISGNASGQSFRHLWFVPYIHDLIALYDGSKWNYHKIGAGVYHDGINAATVNAGDMGYTEIADVFIYDNNGTLTIELHKWATFGAGTSTRAVSFGIVRQNGVWVSENDNTRRFVGTIRNGRRIQDFSTGVYMSELTMNIWNVQNQVLVRMNTANSDNGGAGDLTFGAFQHWSHPNDPTGSTNLNYPIEILVGLPGSVRCTFRMISSSFINTLPVSQTIPEFQTRVGSSVELNNNTSNAVGPPAINDYGTTIALDGNTASPRMSFRASRSDIFAIGSNEFQPIWVGEVWPEPFDPIIQETQNTFTFLYDIEYLR